jgi:hypothetical protein
MFVLKGTPKLRVRAFAELDDMGGTTTSEITVGGTEFGVGLRTRF